MFTHLLILLLVASAPKTCSELIRVSTLDWKIRLESIMSRNSDNIQKYLIVIAAMAMAPASTAGNDISITPNARGGATGSDVSSASDLIEGFTEPYADIDMAAAEMGTLSRVEVKDGDVVKAGQLLANLDDAVLQASLEVARAGMTAEGELKSAETQLELRKVELEKLRELFGRNHASQKELDRVSGEVRIAESRLQSVREDLAVRKLEFARIEAQLQQRQIRSTIDGIVVEVRKDCGEFVSPSDPVVARVVQLDPLLVVFAVPTDRRNQIKKGGSVNLQIGDLKVSSTGIVEYASPTADASSGTFKVKVRLANPNRVWHGGEKTVLMLDDNLPTISPNPQVAKRAE